MEKKRAKKRVAVVDHPLKSKWKSEVFFEIAGVFVADPLVEFDLLSITPTGGLAGCMHGPQAITGRIFPVNAAPVTHVVRFIDQDGNIFRGVAVLDPVTNTVRKIAGGVKFAMPARLKSRSALADQAEATWVATKTP